MIDSFSHRQSYYLVLELMEGAMQRIMRTMQGQLSEEFCRYTLYCVAKGLEAYHELNLIHRSINGEAVLFNSEGVKIADCSDSVFLTKEEIKRETPA